MWHIVQIVKLRGNVSFTDLNISTTEGTAGTSILTGTKTLMMIPQDFTDDESASITINFTPSGKSARSITHKLKDTQWLRGQCVTYIVTTDALLWEYVLEATGGERDYTAGSVTFNIKSYKYKRTSPSTKYPVAWSIDGYKADGASSFSATKPSWLSSITTSGVGTSSVEATNIGTATLTAQTSSTGLASFTDIERGTSSEPYDLSTKGGTTNRNTANCYVINAPGWYKIPLVYGNGIKNGTNNTSAYNSSTFVDYNGTQIRNLAGGPYINQSGTPNNAVVVWQDANNLLDNVSYDPTSPGYIKFHVGTNMVEGNSLIAIRNSSNVIMWSWHLWISSIDTDNVVPSKTSDNTRTYHIMPVPLGWVNGGNVSLYSKRKVEIKISQTGTSQTTSLSIHQNPNVTPSQSGYATIYQWGRKDPQIPINRIVSPAVNKSIFNGIISSFTAQNTTVTLQNAIRTPHIFYYSSSYMWQDNYALYDMWNVGNTQYGNSIETALHQNVIKSVYDPCPVGYKIPPALAFTGITGNSNHNSYGTYAKTNYSPSKIIFIPALGIRSYNSESFHGMTGDGVYGSAYWSSLPIYPPGNGSGSTGAKGADIAIYGSNQTSDFTYVVPAANNWGYNVLPIMESDN